MKDLRHNRQDLVILAECKSPDEINGDSLTHGDVWVQYHNMPIESLTEEGVGRLMDLVGIALLDLIIVTTRGKQLFRIKMLISMNQPIKDKLITTHPTLGDLVVFLVYEKNRPDLLLLWDYGP